MQVVVRAGAWARRVEYADGFLARLLGVFSAPTGAVLIPGRSVHGFGLRRPLWAVAVDEDGVVLEVRILNPLAVVVFRRARWMLELPLAELPPPIGDRLELFE